MNIRDEYTICNEIRNLMFPYFLPGLKKVFFRLVYTNNYSAYSIKVILKDDKIQCISNHYRNSTLKHEKTDVYRRKIYDLFRELKPITVEKYGYWSMCYFYINKDGSFEIDYVCNRRGTENVEEKLPTFIQQKIDEANKGK